MESTRKLIYGTQPEWTTRGKEQEKEKEKKERKD